MGQYYNCLTKRGGKVNNYNIQVARNEERKVGDWNGVKLTEHSWWGNEFMCALCAELFNHKTEVAWVGDYAEDFEWENGRTQPTPKALCAVCWSGIIPELPIEDNGGLTLEDHYLVNHTQGIYLEGNEYYGDNVDKDGWCLHPLSLLTACGNGLGGGDYHGSNMEDIGSWCFDEISVEDQHTMKKYLDKYEKRTYTFKEEY